MAWDVEIPAAAELHFAAGVVPYSINAEPWLDGATAERFIAVPGSRQLDVYQTSNAQIGYLAGHWNYPSDTDSNLYKFLKRIY